MRTSCNGCRILRKGCSEDCVIRPCLDWIASPEAQANATNFLSKRYGRSGLMKRLKAGPTHLRPDIFRSLLYEACGRMVDPVHGPVGLLYSGQWDRCQAAVDSVLNNLPVVQITPQSPPHGLPSNSPPQQQVILPPYDNIRHIGSSVGVVQSRSRGRRSPRVPVLDSDQGSFVKDNDNDNRNKSWFSGTTNTVDSVAGHVSESETGLELTLGLCK